MRLLALLLLFSVSGFAQTHFPVSGYINYTQADGLAANYVTAVAQDSTGFIWIGTNNGLSRFDGYRFLNFHHDPSDSNSLSNNAITRLAVDGQNRLWIATTLNGVSCLDLSNYTFKRFLPGVQRLRDLEMVGRQLFVAAEEGLYQIDLDRLTVKDITFTPTKAEQSAGASTAFGGISRKEGQDEYLWLPSGTCFYEYHIPSGRSNLTGDNNTFVGYQAGFNNTASNNLFMGSQAGYNNTAGDAISFLGVESVTSTTTGSANTFLGFFSGQTNSTGHDNTFIGASAGRFNTIGHSNAFIGNGAGYNNVDGNFNTYMGRDVGLANTTGNSNTFVGYRAGYSATVGNNNFFGYQAGYNTTTGVSNTFLGNVAGSANTTGHDNAFVGSASGNNNTTGHSNVFIGPGAGYFNQTGNFNVYMGRDAGLTGTTGTNNIFIGYQAGYNEGGNNKLYIESSNSSSPLIYGEFDNDMVAVNGSLGVGDISPAADFTVGDGDKFQVDGANGDVLFTDDQASITFPAATLSPAPMIQMFASGTANPDRMVIAHSSAFDTYGLQYQDAGDEFHFLSGGTRVVTIDLTGAGNVGIENENPAYDLHLGNNSAAKPTSNTWTVPSDARLKTDVHDFKDGLAEIQKIRPVTYTYTGEAGLPQETGVGIIAQELKEIAPYMVSTWTYEGEEADRHEYYAVDNGAMTYMLINAIKEQQQMIELLQKQVEVLSNGR